MPRPPDRGIDDAVLAATVELIDEAGYRHLTLEGVARRAGTTKPAIRRRWRDLRHVVVAALAADRPGVVEIDTGCLRCDLLAHLDALAAAMTQPMLATTLAGLVGDLADDPELHDEFVRTAWQPRREACAVSVERARLRGEVDERLDVELLMDLLAGPIVVRGLFGTAPIDAGLPAKILDGVLPGMAGVSPIRC